MPTHYRASNLLFIVVLSIVLSTSSLLAQAIENVLRLHIPRAAELVSVNCSDTSLLWKDVPRTKLSSNSITVGHAATEGPVALVFSITDPDKPPTTLPKVIQNKLDSYQALYAFKWDDGKLYGYIAIKEADISSNHPAVSEKEFREITSRNGEGRPFP